MLMPDALTLFKSTSEMRWHLGFSLGPHWGNSPRLLGEIMGRAGREGWKGMRVEEMCLEIRRNYSALAVKRPVIRVKHNLSTLSILLAVKLDDNCDLYMNSDKDGQPDISVDDCYLQRCPSKLMPLIYIKSK